MLEFDFMYPGFDIQDNPSFNHVNGLNDISQYLDFAISKTIHEQIPNVTEEQEKYYATIILKNYMSGESKAFTSRYGIRKNIEKIGIDKIQNLFLKILIEKAEYNRSVLHKQSLRDYTDQCADYISNQVYNGKFGKKAEWFQENLSFFINTYVKEMYGLPIGEKKKREGLCYNSSFSIKALEQLNIEMSLNRGNKSK